MESRVYLALLRAVNLGGGTQVRMEGLKTLLEGLGYSDVRTVLQSGNALFRSNVRPTDEVERQLESAFSKVMPRPTEFFVRTSAEWSRVVSENPFPAEAESDPAHLTATSLKEAPLPRAWEALRVAIRGREKVQGIGRTAYIVYPDGIGTSRLTAATIERHLETRGTTRNWNTVRKLDELAKAMGGG